MLRRTLVKLSAALLMTATLGTAQAYTAGEDYLILTKPHAASMGTVTKVWTIGCPFCYQYEKFVDPTLSKDIREKAGLRFVPLLLEHSGEMSRRASEFLAYCRLLDEADGRDMGGDASLYRKAQEAWFKAYHDRGERWKEAEPLLKIAYDATGIAPEAFEEARKTTRLQAFTDDQRWGFEPAKLYGVPAYVVNGKYLVMANKTGGYDAMLKLIIELAAKD